jgi:hypothetical protein
MRVPVTYRLTISLIVVLIFSTLALGTASDRIRTAGATSLPGIVQRIAAQNLPLLRSAIGRNLLPAQAPTCEKQGNLRRLALPVSCRISRWRYRQQTLIEMAKRIC